MIGPRRKPATGRVRKDYEMTTVILLLIAAFLCWAAAQMERG
jgi:hypothetical protein